MNNLIVKQILQQKNIPEEIEGEIVKYLPFPEQEKKKKELIRILNTWHQNYWYYFDLYAVGMEHNRPPPKVSAYKVFAHFNSYNNPIKTYSIK